MKPLTYRQLKDALDELNDDQLDMSVSILRSDDEIFPVFETFIVSELPIEIRQGIEDVVSMDQPVLTMQ